ncbi:nuclear transport factor 2 family protein [Magnetovibrio sp. PR-2]|uniref:nuclear transport factor 2 family protein n=1 Tax=Magnetovibrio sp. PR-2 TaxID=3120356 RepID=UPI002FCDFDF6
MAMANKDRIAALLKSIETGDPGPVAVVNEAQYIQHNPQTHEGSEGLAALFQRLSKTSPRVNIVRAFEDGAYVFAHTEYDFAKRNIGFEVFRFENGQAVEHWDNIQARLGPNASGHTMVDGPVAAQQPEHTEPNRTLVRTFVETVLIAKQFAQLSTWVNADAFVEHSPQLCDDISALPKAFEGADLHYRQLHRVLAEGNFVLSVCEGYMGETHTSFYDLFRIEDQMIVEHWDTTETVALPEDWKNDNGKF